MKIRNIILILSIVICNSCIVKSLNPFYTENSIEFNKNFLGTWTDNHNDTWEIISTKEEFLKGKEKISKEDEAFLEKYRSSYITVYKENSKTSYFIATPFKIKNQYFLDFIPYNFEKKNINSLLEDHIIYTHSLVKLDILKDGKINIKWFDEERLKKLFQEKRIKIQHRRTGIIEEDILLTASSEELYTFLKKYMLTEEAEKWETEAKFTLTKS
ncbi:hypothetical protein [Tenacibaculum amylolyticum]|uniref:hypothetical protein n=1 Tax=Tenacibaculum amylolyticum TaxID=104269 RepID=UPI00389638DA